jgi:hypothetical protein
MLNFRDLADRIIASARAELEADLRAQSHPDATPIPMLEHLAQLDARAATAPPLPDVPDEDDDTDPDDGFYEDFDCRR